MTLPIDNPPPGSRKPKWPKFVAMGCGGFLLLLVVGVLLANYYFKRAVVDHLERKMADAGLDGQIGEFDYNIQDRKLFIRDLSAVPVGSKLADLGNVTINEGVLQFDKDEPKKIVRVGIDGLKSDQFSVVELEVRPEELLSAKGVTVKNPKEFGGGDFLKLTELRMEYGSKGLDLLKMNVEELTAVKRMDGKWNLLLKPIKELKLMGKSVDRIGQFYLQINSVKVLDLGHSGTRTFPVNKTIHVRDVNSANDFNSKVLPKLLALIGEVKLAAEKQP
ncbi:MAG: hypothetical protein H8E27_05255 [Verrucomicrobia subdivision 3 bacterium]|nr:hypothetical protein [Limisphaerales bacterium]